MKNSAYLEKMEDPFRDLPVDARPTLSPWDARLVFNTLSPPHHQPFFALMREVSATKAFNRTEIISDNGKLYGLASAAGLDLIATELVRNWGVKDKDGPMRVYGCDKLRSWPEIDSAAPQTLQIWLAQRKPQTIMGIFTLGTPDVLQIRQNNHLVMSSEGNVFTPGNWMADLLVEYARLKIWRNHFGDETHTAPRPATTMLPSARLAAI